MSRADKEGREPAGAGRRVLIVDDIEDQRTTLAALVRSMGHQVLTAGDGASALAHAEEFAPDFVLLDIGMPDMAGYDLARRLRAIPKLNGAVLVAQTGWGQADDRRRSEQAGIDHHLVKPLDLEQLQRILSE